MKEYIKEYLKHSDVEYKENENMRAFSSIKIGGCASLVILPRNKFEFVRIMRYLRKNNESFKILGNMSNVLLPDENYSEIIIKTDRMSAYSVHENTVDADCGVKLPLLANVFCEYGLSGLEELSGIPAQLGGAVFGNAGAFGREISELIYECTVYDKIGGEVFDLPLSELFFSYRESVFQKNELAIISVKLKADFCSSSVIRERLLDFREKRKDTQPVGKPSLGSIFKRPAEGVSAGRLIDECGLRGFSLGGAEISLKHAGFIINRGTATARDVKELIYIAENAVKKKFGIELKREIEFL